MCLKMWFSTSFETIKQPYMQINFFSLILSFLTLKLWMMLASNGCRREVAFLRRKKILMLVYFPTRLSGCTRALSKNSKIFQFSSFIMLLSFCSTFSIITICIQDFASAKKETYPSFDAAFASLKQRGFLLFRNY